MQESINETPAKPLDPRRLAQWASLLHDSATCFGIKNAQGDYLLMNDPLRRLAGPTNGSERLSDRDLFPGATADSIAHNAGRLNAGSPAVIDQSAAGSNGSTRPLAVIQFPIREGRGDAFLVGVIVLEVEGQLPDNGEIQRALVRSERVNTELRKVVDDLELHASTDRLTGAWNRRWLEQTLLNELSRFERYGHPVSILMIDIDHFKQVNDRHGHVVGDAVLRELSERVRLTDRGSDSLVRWGGEEFILLCPNTPLSAARKLAERLRDAVAARPFETVGLVTCSIGVAEYVDEETWADWLERADTALYRAKENGRNRVEYAPETLFSIESADIVGAHFVQLVWRKAYESGNRTIDAQHRELFVLANELLSYVLAGAPTERVTSAAEELLVRMRQHFHDEESILTIAGYEGIAEHAATHARLLERSELIMDRFRSGQLAVGELFQFIGHDLVAKHMLSADRRFFAHLPSA